MSLDDITINVLLRCLISCYAPFGSFEELLTFVSFLIKKISLKSHLNILQILLANFGPMFLPFDIE